MTLFTFTMIVFGTMGGLAFVGTFGYASRRIVGFLLGWVLPVAAEVAMAKTAYACLVNGAHRVGPVVLPPGTHSATVGRAAVVIGLVNGTLGALHVVGTVQRWQGDRDYARSRGAR